MEELKTTEFINDLKDIIIDSGIVKLGSLIETKNNVRTIEYSSGKSVLKQIHNDENKDGYLIEECFMPKGTISNKHEHEVLEWIILISGKAYVKIEEKKGYYILNSNEGIKIKPNIIHRVLCPIDSKLLAIFIPTTDEFKLEI